MKALKLVNPCQRSWEELQGSGSVRYCEACATSVHDLDVLSPRGIGRAEPVKTGRVSRSFVALRRNRLASNPPRWCRVCLYWGEAASTGAFGHSR